MGGLFTDIPALNDRLRAAYEQRHAVTVADVATERKRRLDGIARQFALDAGIPLGIAYGHAGHTRGEAYHHQMVPAK